MTHFVSFVLGRRRVFDTWRYSRWQCNFSWAGWAFYDHHNRQKIYSRTLRQGKIRVNLVLWFSQRCPHVAFIFSFSKRRNYSSGLGQFCINVTENEFVRHTKIVSDVLELWRLERNDGLRLELYRTVATLFEQFCKINSFKFNFISFFSHKKTAATSARSFWIHKSGHAVQYERRKYPW